MCGAVEGRTFEQPKDEHSNNRRTNIRTTEGRTIEQPKDEQPKDEQPKDEHSKLRRIEVIKKRENIKMNVNIYNLEERLIEFACAIVEIVGMIPKNIIGNHFSGQLIRSGSSPALNYAEARDAESKNDFIHKMKIVLKELRETYVCLKIIDRKVFQIHLKSKNYLLKTMS